ncbi:MAG: hypothetical protein ACOY31_06010 [Bacillota bacterium]
MPDDCTSGGRNFFHDYKLLEGLLQWYFGPQAILSYTFREGDPDIVSPTVLVDGKEAARGRIRSGEIVRFIEGLGLKRLDQED